MIELAHMATGVLVGRRCSGPGDALLAGVALHALGDLTPHGELHDTRFEVGSTAVGIFALTARYGLRSPVVWGAVGAVLPDIEHVVPRRIKPARDLFPTHRFAFLHSSEGALAVPAWLQVIAGGAVLGAFVARRRDPAERQGRLARVRRLLD